MAPETQTPEQLGRLFAWAQRVGLERRLVVGLAFAAVISGVLTYLAVIGVAPFTSDRAAVRPLLLVDSILLLSLLSAVTMRFVRLVVARRRGFAGSRLHVRLVAMFALVAMVPTIVVAVVSALFINIGVNLWFGENTRAAINTSVAVANAYVEENRKTIEGDVRAMVDAMHQTLFAARRNPAQLGGTLQFLADARGLPEAMIFDSRGTILARTRFSGQMDLITDETILSRARGGDVVLLRSGEEIVRALMRFDTLSDTYMYVGRLVDPLVLGFAEETRRRSESYTRLENERSRVEVTLATVFVLLALLLLSIAIWLALVFANRLVQPLSSLVGATERVRSGDLDVRVSEGREDDEFGTLSRAFNRMTSQLRAQRGELIEANQQLDERRRFTEAVLGGVSAGVLGLDSTGCITLPNRSATELLGMPREALAGRDFREVLPEMADLLDAALAQNDRQVDGEVTVHRNGQVRELHVRIVSDPGAGSHSGFVVTFDDISELVSAQRRAAWADVARRIAHEIKNPLTPIKLSADRIWRKYNTQITSDQDIFRQCTETIMRQVDDIGRMVDEFSKFARMPAPEFRTEDLRAIVKHVSFLQQSGAPDIAYEISLPPIGLSIHCDRGQITQALTNLMQNAADSIEGRQEEGDMRPGRIRVDIREDGDTVRLSVEDNGRGLPEQNRTRLTEPYVTTRKKGTGLGLAIVKKIMEEHRGRLILEDGTNGGACVSLIFPRQKSSGAAISLDAAAE
jgi:two-component system, NtrC family, nitrogen regulation sensor histidine kinase NtrY